MKNTKLSKNTTRKKFHKNMERILKTEKFVLLDRKWEDFDKALNNMRKHGKEKGIKEQDIENAVRAVRKH